MVRNEGVEGMKFTAKGLTLATWRWKAIKSQRPGNNSSYLHLDPGANTAITYSIPVPRLPG